MLTVELSWWLSAARERVKEGNSKTLLLPQSAERSSHRNRRALARPNARTLGVLGKLLGGPGPSLLTCSLGLKCS